MDTLLSPELLRHISHLELKTKKLLRGSMTGAYMMRKVGIGSEFDELRDYQEGDNVRAIDWKSSARSNKLIVRSYKEDRNRTIILLVDISCSHNFASGSQLKREVMQDIAAMITFAAEYQRDRIGALFFETSVEKVVPLGAGRAHTALLVQEIFTFEQKMQQQPGGTSLANAYKKSLEHFPKQALVVVLSDFLSSDYAQQLAALSHQHDVVALRFYDPVERNLPAGLLVRCQDPETGTAVETTSVDQMAALQNFITSWYAEQDKVFKKLGIDYADIDISGSYDRQLLNFFAQRL